jgi:hypothetical protein
MAWFALLFVGLAVAPRWAQAQSNPSFDCQHATTPVEKLICSDPKLGELDRQMSEKEPALLKEQGRWLEDRAIGCGLDPRQPGLHTLTLSSPAECLAASYEQRSKLPAREAPDGYRPPQPMELPFEASRQPFLPRLLVSRESELCDAFLAGLRQDFLARHRTDQLFGAPPMALGHWIAWPSGFVPFTQYPLVDVAEVDLDQNGQKQLLLQVAVPFNWRGPSVSLLIRSMTTPEILEEEMKDLARALQSGLQPAAPYKRLEPSPSSWDALDHFGYPWKLLSYQGALYLLDVTDILGGGELPPGTAALRRLHADGSLETSCQASIAPKAGALPLGLWWAPRPPPDSLAVPEEVIKWLQTIREIQGNEPQMQGSLHPLSWLIMRSSFVWYDALVRPWETATTRPPYQPAADDTRSWIHQWGFKSLSRFRLVRTFESGRLDALRALAQYYKDAFDLPNSTEAASVAIDNILSASFVVPRSREEEPIQREIRDFTKDREEQATRLLRAALLLGTTRDAVGDFIKAGAGLNAGASDGSRPDWRGTDSPEPALFYALEHPDEAAWLLDEGAEINEGNAFGKTALMYAAHYNLEETVTLLLKRGADLDRRTDASKVMDASVRFDQRTALMYAAENASERVIHELIAAGADTCAIDTGKRDVTNYLSRNRLLSDSDRISLAMLIAEKPCDRDQMP